MEASGVDPDLTGIAIARSVAHRSANLPPFTLRPRFQSHNAGASRPAFHWLGVLFQPMYGSGGSRTRVRSRRKDVRYGIIRPRWPSHFASKVRPARVSYVLRSAAISTLYASGPLLGRSNISGLTPATAESPENRKARPWHDECAGRAEDAKQRSMLDVDVRPYSPDPARGRAVGRWLSAYGDRPWRAYWSALNPQGRPAWP